MPSKLAFSIASCSGEDPDFPATELLYHSPDSKGWCTPRFSQYPQELTLRLEGAARLAQVQLLSHEFKIAAKVELLVGTFEGGLAALAAGAGPGGGAAVAALDPAKASWRRLGFLSFDANERSSFTARELKSVALNGTPAHLLRLVFHRCHANAANIHSQVSLVAVNLMGDPLEPLSPITNTGAPYGPGAPMPGAGMPGSGAAFQQQQQPQQPPQYMQQQQAYHQQQQQPQQPPSLAEVVAALAAELGVDTVTAQRIHDLQQQKQQAVEAEDYDEAKRLKAAVDRLRAAGGAIAALEARKRAAVDAEDYDLAKQLKQEVDRMRSAAYAAAMSGRGGPEAAFSPPHSRRASTLSASPTMHGAPGDGIGGSGQGLAGEAAADYASPPAARRQLPGDASPSPGADWGMYDERPAQAKGAYNFEHATEASLPTTNRRSSILGASPSPPAAARASKANDAGPAPPGFPADLPAPEALSAGGSKDAAPLADLVGEYLARCLYSRTWQLREAALAGLAQDLEAGSMQGLDGSSDALKTLTRCLLRTLKDKVAAVFSASLVALRALVAAQAGSCAPRDLQAAVGELLPLLVEKAADLNQRTREQATETLVALAGVPQAGLRAACGPFLRPTKPNAAWKIVVGRLQLLSALLPVIGMAGKSGEGFQVEAVMAFVNPGLSNSSAEVRGAAIALTLQVAQLAGPSVQRLLPADLNSKVKEQIEAGLLNPTAALAAGPLAALRVSPGPARAAAAGARQQQQPPAAAGSRQQPSPSPPAATTMQQQQQPPQQQQHYPAAPPPPGAADDDPAVYEAEVRAREARLGSSHPDVAEAICNLAIVHNQRGNIGAALPLYERALAIWEAASGADSPDVAHTLTDIAVIHLEQGRDDLGRPLLQRALRIQQAHLGPDHPDVQAIRDVLLEEEGGEG